MRKLIIVLAVAIACYTCTDVMVGHVTNAKQDGHVDWSTHHLEEPYTYINYGGLDCNEGDKVITMEIYSPTNLVDGIVFRKDIVLKGE